MKVVKNACFGGYRLSMKALNRLAELTGKTFDQCREDYLLQNNGLLFRTAPELVQVVEELGSEVNSWLSNLVVEDIPEGIKWTISDLDGLETIEVV